MKKSMETKIITTLILCAILIISLFPLTAYAGESTEGPFSNESALVLQETDNRFESVPKFDSEVNKENALTILKTYDSEGYYIVDYVLKHGGNDGYVDYYLNGNKSNVKGLNIVVHEFFHMYCDKKPSGFCVEAIYTGAKKDIEVTYPYPYEDVLFPTSTWAETLPDNLRTSRFDTYVSRESNASANVIGPYGLLNEFTAYSWGMHNQLELFPYYKAHGNYFDVWSAFVNSCVNDRQAYAEFRFWMLGYLDYAKKNRPDVYEHFMNNRNFIKAYLTTKARSEDQIREFHKRCNEIVSLCAAEGISAKFENDGFWFEQSGIGTYYSTYKTLMDEIAKPDYQAVEADMKKRINWNSDNMDQTNSLVPTETIPSTPSPSTSETPKTTKPMDPLDYLNPTDPSSWQTEQTSHADACPSAKFMDMRNTEGQWFHDGVDYALAKGYMVGFSNTRFNPEGKVTRAQIAQILYAAERKPTVSTKSVFSDVKFGEWYANAVNWAAKNNLVAGYGGGRFGPSDPVTREQLAAILNKYTQFKKYDTKTKADLNQFKDNSKISNWAREAVQWAVANSLISGVGDGILDPKGTATRAQLAVILRAYDKNIRG